MIRDQDRDTKVLTQGYIDREDAYSAHNYAPLNVVITRGEGVYVYDVEGKRYLDCLSGYSALNQGHVHPRILKALIEQARRYPFEELHEFRRNAALCPFHDDKHPSMSLKNNYVRCWSCGWKGDTITFLMEKEGLSFPDAVKRLQ